MSIQSLTGPSQITDVRLRASCDLSVPAARQEAGLHTYDGVVQDLSPSGIAAGLHALSAATSTTWGKLTVLDLRERARTAWGAGFSLARFHRALGSPPVGLLDTAIERG